MDAARLREEVKNTDHDTKARIVEALSRRLAQASSHGVSLTDAAKDTGIRKSSIYHHFEGGKESRFEAASTAFIERKGPLCRTR